MFISIIHKYIDFIKETKQNNATIDYISVTIIHLLSRVQNEQNGMDFNWSCLKYYSLHVLSFNRVSAQTIYIILRGADVITQNYARA